MQTKDFFTLLPPKKGKFFIDHQQRIALWGSCFAQHMVSNFINAGFHASTNPFGVIFNPKSLRMLFSLIHSGNEISTKHSVEKDGMWTSWLFHSSFSFQNRDELIQKGNQEIKNLEAFYKEHQHTFIISLGTAWVYKLLEQDMFVANCHKQNLEKFQKQLLSINEIQESLESIVASIFKLNPQHNVIFTLSPVRHIKDGFVENNRSKSRLLEAILGVTDKYDAVCYFESYELMMDQLRDYRFYEKDLLHPNEMAKQVIWEYFVNKYCHFNTLNIIEIINKYHTFKGHRVMNVTEKNLKKRENQLLKMRETILLKYPNIKLV